MRLSNDKQMTQIITTDLDKKAIFIKHKEQLFMKKLESVVEGELNLELMRVL